MDTKQALQALHALDLPGGRINELARRAVATGDPVERRRIVYRARAEEDALREKLEADFRAELASRAARAHRDREKASQRHQSAPNRRYTAVDGVRHPEARPVAVRYIEPTKTNTPVPVEKAPLARNEPSEVEMKHGLTAYNKYRCRCETCKKAKARSRTNRGLRRAAGTIPEHGTLSRYKQGCRCSECKAETARYARAWRFKKSGK